jgi:hypothetical protein
MPYPRSARPDLCSIRTADEQDELAEAVSSGFSAAGYPLGDDYAPEPQVSEAARKRPGFTQHEHGPRWAAHPTQTRPRRRTFPGQLATCGCLPGNTS